MVGITRTASGRRTRATSRKERSRARIVEAAARLFRRHGYNGVGLMTIMKDAQLTPGAFYAHFQSKEHLFAEVVGLETGLGAELARARKSAAGNHDHALALALTRYLDGEAAAAKDAGCALASLTMDVARLGETAQRSFGAVLIRLIDELAGTPDDDAFRADRDRAIAGLALAAGGLTLARAVADETLAERILAACRHAADHLAAGPVEG